MKKSTFFTKVAVMLLVISIFPFTAFSQHFTPAVNNGAGNWHFYPVTATVGGVALEAGDEIAIYDGAVCVGSHVLTDELDGSYGLAVGNDWLAYETNNGNAGYNGGNSYTFKCWDASASTVYTGTMTYNVIYDPQDYTGGVFPATMEFRWSWIDLAFTTVAPDAGDLTGTITNSVGAAPIESVTVTATGPATYVTTTNASGVYLFDEIDVGTYTISTVHTDFQNYSNGGHNVTDGNTTTHNFTLTYKTGTLSGFVYDQANAVVNGATVTLDNGGGNDDSDGDGVYYITGIAPGTFTATITEPGYANTVVTGIVISANAATSQNFTIYASGTLSGTVTDGTNGGEEIGVLVTVVGTANNATTDGNGDFSFTLAPGTYSLSYTKSGFHDGSASSKTVTAGNITNADITIYEENWTFNDGDPFSNVWTIYLNTVTGDGTALKNGDELAIYAPDERADITAYAAFESGNISSVAAVASGSISAFASQAGESGAITSIISNGGNGDAEFATGLTTANDVDIINTTTYNAVDQTPANIDPNVSFETGVDFVAGGETGDWVLSSSTTTTITTAGAHLLSNGASVTITGNTSYNGTYTISNASGSVFDITLKWAGAGTASWAVNTSSTVTTDAAHELTTGDNITITGTTDYNGTHTISNATASVFDIAIAFTSSQTGAWANNVTTTVTSTAHGRTNGQSVTISGSTSYNGTFTVANKEDDTYEIATAFVANDAAGKWVYGEQMVGLYYLTGPISGAGTTHAMKAFSVLSDASDGYEPGEDFVFKLSYAGGSVLTDLNSTSWTADGGGLTDPGTTFPASSVFSQVNLDFILPDGSLSVDFKDEDDNDPDVDLALTLNPGDIEKTWLEASHDAITFAALSPGTYTLSVTSDRFADTTYTDIVVGSGGSTTKNFVINHFEDETQTVSLYTGYNLASRRIGITSSDMTTFLTSTSTDISTTSDIDYVKDNDPLIDYFAGSVVDNGAEWNITEGNQWKMNDDEDIVIPASTPIAYNADITIRTTGWTMIAYLPDYNLDATTAFADLMEDELNYIRDTDGNSLTYIGTSWVDHIGTCTPGEGFLVNQTGGATTFNYPASTKSASAVEDMEPVHFPFYSGYGNPTNAIYTMYVSGDILETGDEVGIFDGGTLVGATVIESDDVNGNNLVAFKELFDMPGYTPGNAIALKLWKATEDKEYWLNYTITNTGGSEYSYTGTTYPSGDARYSQVEVAKSALSIIDNLAEYINVYPNPSSGYVTISSPEQIDRLMIVNIVGQTVLDMKPGSGNTELNLDGFNPGVYFVNLIIDGQRITKKLTIQ